MAAMIPFIAMGASTLMSASAAQQRGEAAARVGRLRKNEADFEAAQYDSNAGQAVAASQRAAMDQERQARIVQSRALAVAAGSGAGASDPTVTNVISKIAQEGKYRSMLALYQGEEQARQLKAGAAAKRYEGDAALAGGIDALSASKFGVASTLLSGAGKGYTMYDKYGTGSPASSGGMSSGATWDAGSSGMESVA